MSNYKEYSIIMVGKAASSMALSILDGKKESIGRRYPERYLKNATERLEQSKMNAETIMKCLLGAGQSVHFYAGQENEKDSLEEGNADCLVFPCEDSGVFGAIWNMGEYLKTGLRSNLEEIPIDQAAIELCDFEDVNPYESDSTGAYLIAATEPGKVLESLRAGGILGRVIGYTTKENARTIIGPTERYLNKSTRRIIK